jgi:hypothetical protein
VTGLAGVPTRPAGYPSGGVPRRVGAHFQRRLGTPEGALEAARIRYWPAAAQRRPMALCEPPFRAMSLTRQRGEHPNPSDCTPVSLHSPQRTDTRQRAPPCIDVRRRRTRCVFSRRGHLATWFRGNSPRHGRSNTRAVGVSALPPDACPPFLTAPRGRARRPRPRPRPRTFFMVLRAWSSFLLNGFIELARNLVCSHSRDVSQRACLYVSSLDLPCTCDLHPPPCAHAAPHRPPLCRLELIVRALQTTPTLHVRT